MRKIAIFKYITLIVSILFIFSCSEYEKVLKSTDYDLKYRKAKQYFEKKDYARAITLFEQIVNYYRASVIGDSVMYLFAQSYYGEEDYLMSAHYFQELSENYARSPFVEEADYLQGYCYYLMSPRPSLDQENSNLSKAAYQKFLYKHPDSKYVPECKRLVQEIDNKLTEKAYLNAKQYYDLGYYKAAIVALRNCINDHPDTKFREEMMFLVLDANYLLADNSVPEKRKERFQSTLDEYYSFIGEFPASKYNNKVEKIYKNTKEILGL
jgi:outer membrane protein assembly factor BamD